MKISQLTPDKIIEIRHKKSTLEDNIHELVKSFVEDTGVNVDRITGRDVYGLLVGVDVGISIYDEESQLSIKL